MAADDQFLAGRINFDVSHRPPDRKERRLAILGPYSDGEVRSHTKPKHSIYLMYWGQYAAAAAFTMNLTSSGEMFLAYRSPIPKSEFML